MTADERSVCVPESGAATCERCPERLACLHDALARRDRRDRTYGGRTLDERETLLDRYRTPDEAIIREWFLAGSP